MDGVEHQIRIPMPWVERYYALPADEFRTGRAVFAIIWSFPPRGFKLRMGWTH